MGSPGQVAACMKARAALEAKYGPEWTSVIGKMGGRPTFWDRLERDVSSLRRDAGDVARPTRRKKR